MSRERMVMHKMLFNTGVRPENHRDKSGRLIQGEHEEWVGGQLHVVYYLEEEPKPTYRLEHLCSKESLEKRPIQPWEKAIRIVGGGMLSDYAIFFDTEHKPDGNT
jgi:hypothetical protein